MMTRLMKYRAFSVGAMAVALLVLSAPAFAARGSRRACRRHHAPVAVCATKVADDAMHYGKVVSITNDKLVMTNREGEEHSHTLAGDATLTLKGETCTAADLKPGTRIRVTTEGADTSVANRIEGFDKNPESAGNYQDGTVVSITGDKLVMRNTRDKEERTCTLNADVKVTCDGKVCKAADLKPGTRVRVTTEGADARVANRIEGFNERLEISRNRQDGTIVSITGDKLVMANSQGKEEHAYSMNVNVKVTCDGIACKSSDLKAGMRIRVTSESDEPHAAIRVEALDKNLEFASL